MGVTPDQQSTEIHRLQSSKITPNSPRHNIPCKSINCKHSDSRNPRNYIYRVGLCSGFCIQINKKLETFFFINISLTLHVC